MANFQRVLPLNPMVTAEAKVIAYEHLCAVGDTDRKLLVVAVMTEIRTIDDSAHRPAKKSSNSSRSIKSGPRIAKNGI